MEPAPVAPRNPRRAWAIGVAVAISVTLIAGLYAYGSIRRGERPVAATTFEGLAAQTEAVRGLRFRSDVRPEYLSDAEMAAEIRTAVEADDVFTGLPHEEVLQATRLIPEDESLGEILSDATAASVLGFYDPETKRLAVTSSAGETLSPGGRMTMVHELTHAVTDQHFDLGAFVTGDEPRDELSARVALVEGDATLAMTLWSAEYLSFSEGLEAAFEGFDPSATSDVPPAVSELLASPYIDGLAFVRHLHEDGGWAAVDRAYETPPTTTEQILHPEKYLAGEGGEVVDPPRAPPGYRPGPTGVVGELFLRTLLAPGLGALSAVPGFDAFGAVAGWDGGAYRVGHSSRGAAVAFELRWDTEEDADEFAAALRGWFETTFGNPIRQRDALEADGRCLSIRVRGDWVASVLLPTGCPRS